MLIPSKNGENIVVAREDVTSRLIEEIKPLFLKHWQEIGHYKDIELNPEWDAYIKLDSLGMLRVYSARLMDRIVGYNVFFVRNSPHYKQSLQASQDILFVDPEHRGFGLKFIDWCDQQLKAEGVQVVFQHMKAKHSFGPALEKRLGYELIDLIYGRRLDG